MSLVTKILLTINLEGGLSHKTVVETIKVSESVQLTNSNKLKTITYDATHKSRVVNSCVQKLNISELAYNYFISDEMPNKYKAKHNKGRLWHNLSHKEKIEFHCSLIAEGKPFSFTILDN